MRLAWWHGWVGASQKRVGLVTSTTAAPAAATAATSTGASAVSTCAIGAAARAPVVRATATVAMPWAAAASTSSRRATRTAPAPSFSTFAVFLLQGGKDNAKHDDGDEEEGNVISTTGTGRKHRRECESSDGKERCNFQSLLEP